jgi:MFS family permease
MTGKLFDRHGADAVMYPSFLFLTLGLFLLSITGNSWMLLLAGCFVGLGYGTFMSNGQAVCLKEVDPHRVGVALSTYFIGLDLGLGVGPYALGSLHGLFDYSQIYILCGLIPVVVLVLYKLFYKTKRAVAAVGTLKQPINEEE